MLACIEGGHETVGERNPQEVSSRIPSVVVTVTSRKINYVQGFTLGGTVSFVEQCGGQEKYIPVK
jgi:hypothetical protein